MFQILKIMIGSLFGLVVAAAAYVGWLAMSPVTPGNVHSRTAQACTVGIYIYKINKPAGFGSAIAPNYCECLSAQLVKTFGPQQSAQLVDAGRRLLLTAAKERWSGEKPPGMRNSPDMKLIEQHLPVLYTMSKNCGGTNRLQ